jgi:hypothetical protein
MVLLSKSELIWQDIQESSSKDAVPVGPNAHNLSLDLELLSGRPECTSEHCLWHRPGARRRVLDVPAAADWLQHVAAEASMQFA